MKISIIGAGNMALGIGSRIAAGSNHELSIYDRNKEKALELSKHLRAKGEALGENMEGEIVIFAIPYEAIFDVIKILGDKLENKIIVDISNPINYQNFELIPPLDSSGAQEISKAVPKSAAVVKAFNTVFAGVLKAGEVNGEMLDVFIASDDADAGKTVENLVNECKMRGIFVGDLNKSRGLESFQLIHMVLQEKLRSNWMSAVKIIQ